MCSGYSTESRTRLRCKVKVLVTRLCLTLCDTMDCSPPGSSVHGILQAKILEWVAIPIFLTQGLNPKLPHCRPILYQLSHQGSPNLETNRASVATQWAS